VADMKSKNTWDPRRDCSFAVLAGASSAFDISGMRLLDSDLLGADNLAAFAPPDRVAADVARVMRSFGRSARQAVQTRANGDADTDETSARSSIVRSARRPRDPE
jgi:hypothetical protein